jgi:hypothetical protein
MLESNCDIQFSFSSSESVLQVVMFLPLSYVLWSAGAATPIRVIILTQKLFSHPVHSCRGWPMKLMISPEPVQRNILYDVVGQQGHHRHGILYNSSASLNPQSTGFHKISTMFSLFYMIYRVKYEENCEEKAL